MRIPTSNLYAQQLVSVSNQYLNLNNLYQQADTHKKLLAPSDDPVLASRITMAGNYIQNLTSYDQNGIIAANRMQTFESSAGSAVSYVSQVKTLLEAAQNGTNTDEQRQAIALQLNGLLNNLVTATNAQDGSGGYIYSGTYTNVPPYVLANGVYQYQGSFDTTSVNIGPSASVIYNDTAYNIFGNIPNGNGSFSVTANSANTGTSYISGSSVVSSSAYVPDTYTINFANNSAGKLVYTVTGAASGQVIPASGGVDNAPLFESGPNGATLTFNGATVTVTGQPNAGDSFQTAPSQKTDMLNSLQNLITALQAPTDGNPTQLAKLQQVMSQSAQIFATGYSQLVSYQSEVGTRAATVTSQTQLNSGLTTSEEGIMVKLAIADPFQTLSSITQQETYLKASLGAYKEMQNVLMSILQMS